MIEYLYRHHYRYFFTVAYNLCHRWDMAEDLVQDGFIRILNSQEKFYNWQHAKKYLVGCIKHAAFERMYKDERAKAMLRDAMTNDENINASALSKVAASISKLKTAMSRKIIKNIYYHSRSRSDLAKEYGTSRQSISYHEQKALSELKKIIPIYDIV